MSSSMFSKPFSSLLLSIISTGSSRTCGGRGGSWRRKGGDNIVGGEREKKSQIVRVIFEGSKLGFRDFFFAKTRQAINWVIISSRTSKMNSTSVSAANSPSYSMTSSSVKMKTLSDSSRPGGKEQT